MSKKFFGKGLYLLNDKYWRFKYRFSGKEKLISLGSYDLINLNEALKRRDLYRSMLAEGLNPSTNRKYISLSYWKV